MQKKISKEQIKKAVGKCFAASNIISIKKYTNGNINQIFEIKLKGAKQGVMLRVFNEDWKAKKEEFIYRDIRAHIDIPVPEVYCADDSKKILPYAYILMSKVEGGQIDYNYKRYKNKKLFEQAGEILAKLHSIKFPKFGWIVGNEINPAFNRWRDFVWHDIELKLSNIKKISKVMKLTGDIEYYLNRKGYLLDILKPPCLIHKDYHCSHILTDSKNVTGIIDMEWAIAGHNENDFIKMELWALAKMKDVRDAFFKGYLRYGHISDDYTDRKKLYELYHLISMVNISYEVKNKIWLEHNIKSLQNFLK